MHEYIKYTPQECYDDKIGVELLKHFSVSLRCVFKLLISKFGEYLIFYIFSKFQGVRLRFFTLSWSNINKTSNNYLQHNIWRILSWFTVYLKKKELYINEKDVYAAHWTPAFLFSFKLNDWLKFSQKSTQIRCFTTFFLL